MIETLGHLGSTLAKLFGDSGSCGMSTHQKKKVRNSVFGMQSFSSLIPYEAYDKRGLFINAHSMGFTLEALPLVGGDDASINMLQNIVEETLVEGASIQFLLLADHRIDPFLAKWASGRSRDETYREIVQKRMSYFKNTKKISPRIFRLIISYSIPVDGQDADLSEKLLKIKDKLLKHLSAITHVFSWKAENLIRTVGGMVNFNLGTESVKRTWNPFQSLNSQIPTGGQVEIEEENLIWKNDQNVAFRSYRVVDTPEYWSPFSMGNLIGDMFRDRFQISHPFYLHYGVHMPRQEKALSAFRVRSQLIENQGKSSALIRLIPELVSELKECDYVRRALHDGAKFVWTQLSIGLWSEEEKISEASQALKSLFNINHFSIAENRCLHLPHFLSNLPMAWSEYCQDLNELEVLKTTISTECVNFMPMQGEWMGTQTPGMLLMGRRGQLMNWNPFDNNAGNYNCVVVGRSGSGKSVFMQEMLLNGLSMKSHVFVIDVGRSFEKLCDVLNGQKIEFSKDARICLNPFSTISIESQEDRETAFTFLKSIISSMAAPSQGTSDLENALIEKAVINAWKEKGRSSTITDVARWLSEDGDEKARTLSTMLTPYTKDGVYAKYFEGENDVNFSNPMVLIELEELKGKKDLQSVVLQLFIMTIANRAFLGDRRTPFYICIDEAWDLLKAKQTREFIETLARRLRKYHGSLLVGTQSIDDFFLSPGAQAAFENSDWMCLLSQKKSSINQLFESGKIGFNESMLQALESVTTRHGEYSEIMICDADSNFSIARLILDPFSELLFSTKAEEFYQIKQRTSQGATIVEAINAILEEKGR